MTDRKMSNFEFATLNYFITRAFLVGIIFNALLNIVKQDSWIIPIISIIPALLIIILINYIINYKPDLNLANKIISLFNMHIAIFILIFLVLFYYFISLLNYLNFNNFIQSQFLNKTPILAIAIMFSLATYYIVNKGINVISRTSNILFYIAFSLLILSFLGLIPSLKIDNLKPLLVSSYSNYLTGLNTFYAFSILPMFLLTIIPKNMIKNPKIKKILIISYIVSALSIFLIMIQTIATFGYELSILYEYPEFFALKHVILIELSSRVESILAIQLIFDIFIYNIFIVYFIGKTTQTILKIKKSNIVYLVICTLIVIGTSFISKYNTYLDKIVLNIIPIIASIFVTFIIILICIKIKMSRD